MALPYPGSGGDTLTRRIPFALIGTGNIGRNLLEILVHRGDHVEADYGLRFVLVGAADTSGAAIDADGLDIATVRDLKFAGRGVSAYPRAGRADATALEMLDAADAELVVDASPTNLRDGEPGLSCVRASLSRGHHVVLANKGPLVLAFGELSAMARSAGVKLLCSGTVAGGLPTLNIGVRDLAGSGVHRVEGLFNGTTHYILTRMEEEGIPYEQALMGAQEAGIAESDPTLDVDGWDAANKLVIIANAVLRRPTTLEDVSVKGIREITLPDLRAAHARGQVIKPLAIAERQGEGYRLTVGPVALDEDHPFAHTRRWHMGVVYYTDYMGVISATIEEKGPVATSAAVLRDMINVYARE